MTKTEELLVPPFRIGQHVTIKPREDMPARVIEVSVAEDGWTVHVRYFHGGEPKTIKCFPDEVAAVSCKGPGAMRAEGEPPQSNPLKVST